MLLDSWDVLCSRARLIDFYPFHLLSLVRCYVDVISPETPHTHINKTYSATTKHSIRIITSRLLYAMNMNEERKRKEIAERESAGLHCGIIPVIPLP